MSSRYERICEEALRNPLGFWAVAAKAVDWDVKPRITLQQNDHGQPQWFADGKLNTCFNAVDRHVLRGRGSQPALIHDSPVTQTIRVFTYAEIKAQVARIAGMFRAQGVGRGDRVVIYMPMIPEAVFSMLACARLGAIHSVVFGGFAAPELAKRIDATHPKLVISASCGIEPGRIIAYKPLLDAALDKAEFKVPRVLMLQRPQCKAPLVASRDLDWHKALAEAQDAECVSVASTDPLYILYTSGTTGQPKGIVRDNGGHATALLWSMLNVYGLKPGEVWWAASDIGWVLGHSFMIYAPLLSGCTTILYEGKPVGTPDAGAYWRVVRDHGVHGFFTAPTAFRAIRKEDPQGHLIGDLRESSLRVLFLAGERADPATLKWAEHHLRIPVIDNWWQTELGWPALAASIGMGETATRHGSAGRIVPGYQLEVLDAQHRALPPNAIGDIALKLPLPPGCLTTLWNDEPGMQRSYLEAHPGYYTTGDAGFQDEDGYVHVMSRTDDIINVAGHRLSSGGIEQVVASHPDVAECAVIAAADEIKGSVPIGLVVLKAGVSREAQTIVSEIVASVRETIGAVASFKSVAVIPQLPKTRSGKILRSAIRKLADCEPCEMPPTIDDPAALEFARDALRTIGYGDRVRQ